MVGHRAALGVAAPDVPWLADGRLVASIISFANHPWDTAALNLAPLADGRLLAHITVASRPSGTVAGVGVGARRCWLGRIGSGDVWRGRRRGLVQLTTQCRECHSTRNQHCGDFDGDTCCASREVDHVVAAYCVRLRLSSV